MLRASTHLRTRSAALPRGGSVALATIISDATSINTAILLLRPSDEKSDPTGRYGCFVESRKNGEVV